MKASTPEKKRNKRKNKTKSDKKKRRKDKDTSKNDVKIEDDGVKKKESQKPKKVSESVRKAFMSTVDPYDGPLKWWETEHVRYAINYPPVRLRLERVMRSHVVRLTDRKYMLLLMDKLHKDHTEQQKIRIGKRKLSPPSIISRLLEVSYNTLSRKMNDPTYTKLNLYV